MHIYRNLRTIKALSFDLDDTLYDNKPVIQYVEREMVKWLYATHPVSASIPLETWQIFKKQVVISEPELRHDVTRWRKKQIEFGLIQLGYSQHNAEQAANDGIEHALWLRNHVDVPDETHKVMSLLAEKRPLIAITNGNVDANVIGLGDYFQFVLRAGPDGRAKPHSDMFDLAAKKLAIPSGNILHIGDHPVSDVQGAIHSGWQACWLNETNPPSCFPDKGKVLPDIEITRLEELILLL